MIIASRWDELDYSDNIAMPTENELNITITFSYLTLDVGTHLQAEWSFEWRWLT
jgi:hypothetical protein